MDNKPFIYNEDIAFTWLKIAGIGTLIIIGYIILDAHFQAKEYPMLPTKDFLNSERVSSLKKERGVTFVDFETGLKYKLGWGENLNYEDFPTITSLLRIGDLVTKNRRTLTLTNINETKTSRQFN